MQLPSQADISMKIFFSFELPLSISRKTLRQSSTPSMDIVR